MKRSFRGAWALGSGAAQLLASLAGFVTNVLYARQLSVIDMGLIGVVNGLGICISVLVDRGLGTWITQAIGSREISSRLGVKIAWRAARFPLGLILVVCLICHLVVDAGLLSVSGFLPLGAALVATSYWWYSVGLSALQGTGRAGRRSIVVAANGFGTLGLTVAAFALVPSPETAIGVSVFVYGLLGIVAVRWSIDRNTEMNAASVSRGRYRLAISEARAPLATNVFTYALGQGDVVIAGILLAGADVGLFQVGKKVSQVLVLPFLSSLPVVLGKMSSDRQEVVSSKLLKGFILCGTAFCMLLLFIFPVLSLSVPKVFGAEYAGLGPACSILVCVYVFQFFRDLMGTFFGSSRRFRTTFQANAISVLALLLGSAIFRPGNLEGYACLLGGSFVAGLVYLLIRAGVLGLLDWRSVRVISAVALAVGAACGVGVAFWSSVLGT